MEKVFFISVIIIMLIYYYIALQFSKNILDRTSKHNFDSILISVINVVFYFVFYFTGLSFACIVFIMGIILLIEFCFISQASFKQIVFGATVFSFNIVAVTVLLLVCFSHILKIPTLQVISEPKYFYVYNFSTYLLLIILLKLVSTLASVEKIKEVSSANVYSILLTLTSSLMTMYLYLTVWRIMKDYLSVLHLVSTIVTVFSLATAFYCLFFFNIRLIILHPYKRKSDQADAMHQRNLKKQAIVEEKLNTDNLTKLYNRRFIEKKLNELCSQSDIGFGVIYCDLAALKCVNDTYGHGAGDRYIIHVACALKSSVRNEDFVARIGGDEFLLLLFETSNEELKLVEKRIRENIEKADSKESFKIHVNLGGIYIKPGEYSNDSLSVMNNVDILMQKDKRNYYLQGGVSK